MCHLKLYRPFARCRLHALVTVRLSESMLNGCFLKKETKEIYISALYGLTYL